MVVSERIDGVDEGALKIRNRCFREVCREIGVGGEGGDISDDAEIEGRFILGGLLPLLVLRRCRKPFSSGRGGNPDEGGGLGVDRDILIARWATESRNDALAERGVTAGDKLASEGGAGNAKLGAGRGGGGTDRLLDLPCRDMEKRECEVLAVLTLELDSRFVELCGPETALKGELFDDWLEDRSLAYGC